MKFQKSYDEILRDIEAQHAERGANPWRRVLERELPANITCICTVAILDFWAWRPRPEIPDASHRRCALWASFH